MLIYSASLLSIHKTEESWSKFRFSTDSLAVTFEGNLKHEDVSLGLVVKKLLSEIK